MKRKIRLVGLTLGDAFNPQTRSGVNYSLFSQLKQKCDLIRVFDLDLRGIRKACVALGTFSFNRRRWGNKLHQNAWAFDIRSAQARRVLNQLELDVDLVFQDGAMFVPPTEKAPPFVSYHDSNVLLASNGGALSQGAHYSGNALKRAVRREKRVYESAALIFTMSNWLKESLIRDFQISPDKIVTVYAGTNLPVENFQKEYDGRTILFVGANFERKGGPVLLEAFRRVKKEVKDARLVVIGSNINVREDGVETVGRVSDKATLADYFRRASVFALPSFYEPFGLVFAEAFAFKTPCIGTNICAMPEIIEEGRGGWVVPVNDSKNLADRIVMLLRDPVLAAKMGEYGFRKTSELFNWDIVVDKMVSHCERVLSPDKLT
ncbi:MAG: glycosyltransferase family 4 protein [Candidatus Manganitrophus sp.]|nr:glycosyltransferase family 4 protein [Candidatus Manganitrophus sp.]MDC4226048.1 glycosyltransferase family 4 protein [Candidatus Manganitrophus sp.]WDT72697.1 MAG: glycosyltransferase family 4 protein [Candidatus Manganitrophus sp.]WDT75079.1 MAG: glycosyltransferase family 4 protein [Candidatus Manganitrophus sp.]WDT79837.1 MAG: glycosyltransferase family 4 protein [Candidatus Manganitrophus sp.]